MPLDPERTPIVVGVGRYTQPRSTKALDSMTPFEVMAHTGLLAAQDAGVDDPRGLLASVDCVGHVATMSEVTAQRVFRSNLSKNWAASVAKEIGASPKLTLKTDMGGNSSQMIINEVAEKISNGEVKSALLTGCEMLHSLAKALSVSKADGKAMRKKWIDTGSYEKATLVGPPYSATMHEVRHGLSTPVRAYALFEQALRAHRGLTVDQHMLEQAKLFSGFSKVASEDPEHAWFPKYRTAEEMANPESQGNRYVGYPYTKFLCAIMKVDQSASCLVMSVAEARRRGVPKNRWIYMHGCADTKEKEILERPDLHRSPAMHVMGRETLKSANVSLSQIKFFDIYSCFPVAVDVSCHEIGIKTRDGTKLTQTGGLPYHGGPGNNYSMHGLAVMAEKLRAAPGTFGLVTANGGFLSKHAAGVFSTVPYEVTHPHATRWERRKPAEYQRELDSAAPVRVNRSPEGVGSVETYTVVHNNTGLYRAVVIGRMRGSGDRFVAISNDKALMVRMKEEEFLGRDVSVSTDGESGLAYFTDLQSASSKL